MSANYRIRFCNNNNANSEGTTTSFSSENTLFPFSNTLNNFRKKVWKPTGRFTVVASNSTIHINDGTTRSLNMSVGETYDTPLLFAARLTSLLNSSSTGWTVSYDVDTKKFSVENTNPSFILLVSVTTNAVWDTIGFTGGVDIDMSVKRTAPEVRIHTSEHVIYDLGYNALCNFVAMLAPVEIEYPLSSVSNFVVYANNVNDFTSPPFSYSVPKGIDGHMTFFEEYEESSLMYRYWKIEFSDRLNTNELKFSYIYLGDYQTLTSGSVVKGFTKEIVDLSNITTSEDGTNFFDEKQKVYKFTNTQLAFLNKDQREEFEQFFYINGISYPFFISFDPLLKISNNLDEFTKWVHFENSPTFIHIANDYFTFNFDLRENV